MRYSVTYFTTVDGYGFSSVQHYVGNTPEEVAIAERTHVFDECLGLENYEIFDRCYENEEPDQTELFVLGEDGSAQKVVVESWPTTYDVCRKKPIKWEHLIVSSEPSNMRFRWHEFTAEDTDDREGREYPYGAVHHVCKDNPCSECAELDATIAARRVC